MQDIEYEWSIETVDEHGDIIDGDFVGHARPAWPLGPGVQCALVRDVWRADGKLLDRQWAYLDALGRLPAEFRGCAKVPQRFLIARDKN